MSWIIRLELSLSEKYRLTLAGQLSMSFQAKRNTGTAIRMPSETQLRGITTGETEILEVDMLNTITFTSMTIKTLSGKNVEKRRRQGKNG